MSRSASSFRAIVLAHVLVVAFYPASARAQTAEPSAANRLAAEQLFEAARRDLRAGRTADACPKLEESQRLDPGLGTLLHLGECYERLDRTASAWSAFREAIPLARANGDGTRERLAQERADALLPRLARIMIEIADGPRPTGLALSLDDVPFGEARWGVGVPVNPGPHRVRARAPGHREQTLEVVTLPGKTSNITIPPLLREEEARPPASLTPPPGASAPPTASSPPPVVAPPAPRRSSTLPIIGIAASGVTLAAGGFFGMRALRAWNESRPFCDADNACDPAGLSAIDRAKGSATIATALLATGAVVGTATVVLVLSSSPRKPRVALGTSGVTLAVGFR